LIAVDTSVVVPAFAAWHQAHDSAIAVLARKPRLPAHAALESFSVITRLPPPQRPKPAVVLAFLRAHFGDSYLTLSAAQHATLLEEATAHAISGGAVYDALIAATAREAGATLISRDLRAAQTYELIGTSFELLI
jgi:predicted nucleic acid-binding protein